MSESTNSTQAYVFGRSVGEQSIQQLAQILAPVTRQFLEQAWLCAGMKVLEAGSGAGDVAFQEADLTRLGSSVPPVPLFEQVGDWIKEPFRREGLDIQFGLRLYHVFLEAGLPAP